MTMKKIIVLLITAVISFSLTACGTSKKDTNTSSNGNGDTKISGTITVFGWGGGAELQARKEATKIFEKLYPNVKVKEIWIPATDVDTKLDAALAAGNAGDVIMMSPDWYGLRSKWFEDLTPYVKKDHLDLANLYTPGVDSGYVDPSGKREGLPTTASCFLFAYNKDIFDKAGVPYPTNDWTWDDFVNIAKKVSSGTGTNRTYAIVSHWILPSFAPFAYGGRMYNNDWTNEEVDTPNSLKGLQMFENLINSKAMPDDAASKSMPMDQMFVSGKAAMYPLGLFEVEDVVSKIGNNFKWSAVMPPRDPSSGKTTNIKFQTGFAMNASSKNKEAAWAYIKTVSLNKEINDLYCKVDIPALKESAENTLAKMDLPNSTVKEENYVNALKDAVTNPWGGTLNKAGDQYTQLWQAITTHKASAQDAVKQFAPKIQEALDEIHKK